MKQIKILFICMGNICRSPTAHAVFRQMVLAKGLQRQILIDSAGTHAYHVGNSPDGRSSKAALLRGVDMSDLVARQLSSVDFEVFDYLLVADDDNFYFVQEACPAEHRHKIAYILEYAKDAWNKEVPDPYYGKGDGFEKVLDLLESACEGLLLKLENELV